MAEAGRHRSVVGIVGAGALIVGAAGLLAGGVLGARSLAGVGAIALSAAGGLFGTLWAAQQRAQPPARPSPSLVRTTFATALLLSAALPGNAAATVLPPTTLAACAAGVAVVVGLSALVARYFAEEADLPEAPGLAAAARAVGFAGVLSIAGLAASAAGVPLVEVRVANFLALLALALAVEPLLSRSRVVDVWPTDLLLHRWFFARWNPLGSLLARLDDQFGIDVRSTWALQVLRQGTEPVLVLMIAVAWLSTAFTVVGPSEQGLLERFGVAADGPPLDPGLHVHLPWPIDRVERLPVLRATSVAIGHDGDSPAGPEDVLWAKEHAITEYTLVLGDGRDLVTVDATLQYRIVDAHAWKYSAQNPEDLLRAIAYRAVMDATVDRTLSDVLSENVELLAAQLTKDVQAEADGLGLGVQVLGFTIGGLHPPVPVARDYEAVVSAQIAQQTAVVEAHAYANTVVPGAEAEVIAATNGAKADGAKAEQTAVGESAAFTTLAAAYQADPRDFRFRRRLETLESGLPGHSVTVIDSRIERDGGELWLMP